MVMDVLCSRILTHQNFRIPKNNAHMVVVPNYFEVWRGLKIKFYFLLSAYCLARALL